MKLYFPEKRNAG